MSEFEDQQSDAIAISAELAGTMLALGVDWHDQKQMRMLARDALAYRGKDAVASIDPEDVKARARQKLFGLIMLMLRTMEEGAELGEHIHGNDIWKALEAALWAEKNTPHE